MRSLSLAVAFIAVLPVNADDPRQVQLDLAVLYGPQTMLDRPEIAKLFEKGAKSTVARSVDVERTVTLVTERCGGRAVATLTAVTLSGTQTRFVNGGEISMIGGGRGIPRCGMRLDIVPTINDAQQIRLDWTVEACCGATSILAAPTTLEL